MRKATTPRVKGGGGNIFADLGLPNAEQELLKAQLTLQIYKIVKARGLTQAQAGSILGIKQPHVSALMRNRTGNFSSRMFDGVSNGAWAGRGDHSEADAEGEGRDGCGGEVRTRAMLYNCSKIA